MKVGTVLLQVLKTERLLQQFCRLLKTIWKGGKWLPKGFGTYLGDLAYPAFVLGTNNCMEKMYQADMYMTDTGPYLIY